MIADDRIERVTEDFGIELTFVSIETFRTNALSRRWTLGMILIAFALVLTLILSLTNIGSY